MILWIDAGARDESAAAVVTQPAAVRQVPALHDPHGHLLHHQHGHLAQLDLQDAAHSSHAQVGSTRLRQVPASAAAHGSTAGQSTAGTGAVSNFVQFRVSSFNAKP